MSMYSAYIYISIYIFCTAKFPQNMFFLRKSLCFLNSWEGSNKDPNGSAARPTLSPGCRNALALPLAFQKVHKTNDRRAVTNGFLVFSTPFQHLFNTFSTPFQHLFQHFFSKLPNPSIFRFQGPLNNKFSIRLFRGLDERKLIKNVR